MEADELKIEKLICAEGRTGFFFDDQRAIKGGAKADGSAYIGQPVTDGFTAVRQAGACTGGRSNCLRRLRSGTV